MNATAQFSQKKKSKKALTSRDFRNLHKNSRGVGAGSLIHSFQQIIQFFLRKEVTISMNFHFRSLSLHFPSGYVHICFFTNFSDCKSFYLERAVKTKFCDWANSSYWPIAELDCTISHMQRSTSFFLIIFCPFICCDKIRQSKRPRQWLKCSTEEEQV